MEKYIISRHSVLAALVFVLLSTRSIAQMPHLNLGFNVGSYNSNVTTQKANNVPLSFTGISADVFGRVSKGRLLFQSGLTYRFVYRMKTGQIQQEKISSDYLGVPLEAGFNIVKGRFLKWRVTTNLSPLLRVSADESNVFYNGEKVNRWLLPAGLGTGLDVGVITFNFRYNYLLNSFFENGSSGGFTAMNISAGMIF